MSEGVERVASGKSIPSRIFYLVSGMNMLLTVTSLILAAVLLGIVAHRLNSKVESSDSQNGILAYADQIKIDDLIKHLGELQAIADRSNGTRAAATRGFNETLDYITGQLEQHTNFIVKRQTFTVKNYVVRGTPQLLTRINGTLSGRNYSTEFTHVIFSSRADFNSFVRLVPIPNFACTDSDWKNVSDVADSVALVIRGSCAYTEKSSFAQKYRAKGLLFYNDGLDSDRFLPVQNIRNNLNSTIPVYSLSYSLGMSLLNATTAASTSVDVQMNIDVTDAETEANVCADTPTGDPTKTIVIGSHSDSVPAGSGINDNGRE